MLTRKLRDLVFPEGILLLAAVALVHWGAANPPAAPVVRLYPLVVLAAGGLLGWRVPRGAPPPPPGRPRAPGPGGPWPPPPPPPRPPRAPGSPRPGGHPPP